MWIDVKSQMEICIHVLSKTPFIHLHSLIIMILSQHPYFRIVCHPSLIFFDNIVKLLASHILSLRCQSFAEAHEFSAIHWNMFQVSPHSLKPCLQCRYIWKCIFCLHPPNLKFFKIAEVWLTACQAFTNMAKVCLLGNNVIKSSFLTTSASCIAGPDRLQLWNTGGFLFKLVNGWGHSLACQLLRCTGATLLDSERNQLKMCGSHIQYTNENTTECARTHCHSLHMTPNALCRILRFSLCRSIRIRLNNSQVVESHNSILPVFGRLVSVHFRP